MVLFLLFFFIMAFAAATFAVVTVLQFFSPVINVLVLILAVLNALVFLALLFVYLRWKRSGKMGRDYLSSFTGWKRNLLLALKYTLILLLVWEALVTAMCAVYLIFQPIGLIAGEMGL